MNIVYTTGVFDILHPGHLYTLRNAAVFGDKLIVGVQSDESVHQQKGTYPSMSTGERMHMLEALPFVDTVFPYTDVDQRPMLEKIRPDVMVQTEEWVRQTDRTDIINYLADHDIRLILLPIDKRISSTLIKKRVLESAGFGRKDMDLIRTRVDIVSLEDCTYYELPDENRTRLLQKRIKNTQEFYEPVVIATHNDQHILIDGVNRVAALRKLGADKVLAQIVSYKDKQDVELKNNVHYLDISETHFFALLENATIEVVQISRDEAIHQISKNEHAAWVSTGDKWFALSAIRGSATEAINRLVRSYISTCPVYRESEFSREGNEAYIRVVFRRYVCDEVLTIARDPDAYIESGVTWHDVKFKITHFKMPLKLLTTSYSLSQAKSWLSDHIQKKIDLRQLRYYPSNVYVCDDYE